MSTFSSFFIHSEPPVYRPLAIEHDLFDRTEQLGFSSILVWESSHDFVVLGHGNAIHHEIDLLMCEQDAVPIYRRISGGGTVLQGQGCLNYSYIFPISDYPELNTISGTTQFFLHATQAVLQKLGIDSQIQGTSDLTLQNKKFSGNAQKRTRKTVLFHGTILYNYDLAKIGRYLRTPTRQPAYRQHRSHDDFITNISIDPGEFYRTLSAYWDCTPFHVEISQDCLDTYAQQYYQNRSWIFKF